MNRALVISLLATGACVDPGIESVAFDVSGAGVGVPTFETREDPPWEVRLERADVSFGPLAFCATRTEDPEDCATAEASLERAMVVDTLSAEPQRLGEALGLSTTVSSVQGSYGVVWLLPAARPAPLPGTVPEDATSTTCAVSNEGDPRLPLTPSEGAGCRSARFRGVATRDGERFAFEASFDLTPIAPGSLTLRGIDIGADRGERLELDRRLEEIVVRADPAGWWGQLRVEDSAAGTPGLRSLSALQGEPDVVVLPEDGPLVTDVRFRMQDATFVSFEPRRAP